MIVKELYMTRRDGVNLYRVYSSNNCYIERNGEMYEEAIDPEGIERFYNETDFPITNEDAPAEEEEAGKIDENENENNKEVQPTEIDSATKEYIDNAIANAFSILGGVL